MTDIGKLLEAAAAATGTELKRSAREVTLYVAGRTAHLVAIANEPGFEEALAAEADSVALYAGVHAVSNADGADARVRGIIEGALVVGVQAALPAP